MKKLNQTGSHAIAFVVGVLVVAIVSFAGLKVISGNKNNVGPQKSAETNQKNDGNSSGSKDDTRPQLQNLGIAKMGPFDKAAGTSGDLLVTNDALRDYEASGHKGLYVFGEPLPGGSRINPNFEFAAIKKDANIVAAINGIVAFIKDQPDSKDSEVFLMTSENSSWIIGYDHLINLKVKKGDTVKAGDVLGNPAVQNNGFARFEIQINYEKDGQTLHYCPTSLLAERVKSTVQKDMTNLLTAWESISGKDLYGTSSQANFGCAKEKLTAAESGSQ